MRTLRCVGSWVSISRASGRRRFGLFRSLIALAVFLALVVAADVITKAMAPYWMARDMTAALGLSERPSVSVGGLAFLPRLASGEVPLVAVRMQGTAGGALTVSAVSLTLHSVRFSRAKFLSGHLGSLTVGKAEGSARITGALAPAIQRNAHRTTVRFERGQVLLVGGGLRGTTCVTFSISGRTLRLRCLARGKEFTLPIGLPEFLPGIEYTAMVVGVSSATLSFYGTDVLLHPPSS